LKPPEVSFTITPSNDPLICLGITVAKNADMEIRLTCREAVSLIAQLQKAVIDARKESISS
jgi:hypothetical protein